jgi:hypothetical protein
VAAQRTRPIQINSLARLVSNSGDPDGITVIRVLHHARDTSRPQIFSCTEGHIGLAPG